MLNAALAARGLSLTNMGDIMEQTVSGAVSTGTHGTGRTSASVAAQITGLELVLADGSVVRCSAAGTPQEQALFAAARGWGWERWAWSVRSPSRWNRSSC